MSKILTNMREAVGKMTSRDIFSDKGILLISSHTVILDEHIELFLKHGIVLRWEDLIESAAPDQDIFDVQREIDESVKQVSQFFDDIRMRKKIPLAELRNNVVPTVEEASRASTLYELLGSLQARDDYTYRHNVAVGTYANLLGGWLRLERQELLQLTTAALLHDVGKMLVPEHILNKPGKLTDEEFEEMKKHTIYGYELLQETAGINDRQALVALQHHERLDGNGYPHGISGDQIDLFSRIVAVADVFHAMTSNRVYRDASPFYEVLVQMKNDTYGSLDPAIVNLFIQKLMSTLIGRRMQLTDGREGVLIMVNAHDPIRPLVHVDGEYVDLSKDFTIHISKIL